MVILDPCSYSHDRIGDYFRNKPRFTAVLTGTWNRDGLLRDFAPMMVSADMRYWRMKAERTFKMLTPCFVACLEEGVWMQFTDSCGEMGIELTAGTADKAKEWMGRLRTQYLKRRSSCQPFFYILRSGRGNEFGRKGVLLQRRFFLSNDDLVLHYGAGFLGWEDGLIAGLGSKKSGLCIFQGEPGTGKTSFIRHLMYRLRKSHVCFFIPSGHFDWLVSTHTLDFWMEQLADFGGRRLLAILEDAEGLLAPRDGGQSASVSSLLNLSDGLMGDALGIQLLCTVNCPLSQLDPAVQRGGRLIAYREFTRLGVAEAERLARAKGVTLPPGKASYSLADIYHRTVEPESTISRRLGFGLNEVQLSRVEVPA